jgi:hypothetical protein
LFSGDVSTDYLQLLTFAFHRDTHEIIFLEKGRDLTIGTLNYLKEQGYDLLVLVINCSYSKGRTEQSKNRANIWLSVELQQIQALHIPECTMTLGAVDVQYRNDEGAAWTVKKQSFCFTNAYRKDGEIDYLNDTIYTAQWDYYEGESHYWGDISIIIDPETLILEGIDFNQNERFIDRAKGSDWKIESHLQCGSVLLDSDLRFRADQTDIADYIVRFEYRRESYSTDLTLVTEVDEIYLNENSYLEIRFSSFSSWIQDWNIPNPGASEANTPVFLASLFGTIPAQANESEY